MNWQASIPVGGTPGRANSVLVSTYICRERDGRGHTAVVQPLAELSQSLQ